MSLRSSRNFATLNRDKKNSKHMLAARVIPCLDVHGGRVVKGTNFVNLRDAGDPVEVARRYEAEGADELVFLDITASHEERDIILDVVRPNGRASFHAADGGRRCANDRRCSRIVVGRLRQSFDQLGGLQGSRVRSSCRRSIWQPMHRREHRSQTCAARTVKSFGKFTSTADASRPVLMAVDWAREVEQLGCGRNRADQHGCRRDMRRLRFPDHGGGQRSGDDPGRRQRWCRDIPIIWSMRFAREKRTRHWRRAFFILGSSRLPKPSKKCGMPESRCGFSIGDGLGSRFDTLTMRG